MGSKTLVYKQKVINNLSESYIHLKRLNDAFLELEKSFKFPITIKSLAGILDSHQYIAYSDQIFYRFSKLQDCMGARLFKSILMHQGENVDKPFLDILNRLEKIEIIDIEKWFEIRELRNDIAHDYENGDGAVIDIINMIYKWREDLNKILKSISDLVK